MFARNPHECVGLPDFPASGRGTILVAFLGSSRARCHSRTCLCMEYLSSGGVSCLLVVPLFPGRAPLEMMEVSIPPFHRWREEHDFNRHGNPSFLHFCEIKNIHTHTEKYRYADLPALDGRVHSPPLSIGHCPTKTPPLTALAAANRQPWREEVGADLIGGGGMPHFSHCFVQK